MLDRRHMLLALLLALPGCDSDAPAPPPEKGPPAIFPGGEYEVSALTETLKSTDRADGKAAPVTTHKLGATDVRKICSPAGPMPSPTLFTDPGDSCTATADYARDGRLNMSYECSRSGHGPLTATLDGNYDAGSFEVEVVTATRFVGPGDYDLSQRIKGKRVGDCTAQTRAAS